MKNIKIMGNEYPIEYTVEAHIKVSAKGENISDIIDKNPVFILATMLQAAYHRRQQLEHIDGVEPPTEDELGAILLPKDLKDIIPTLIEVMNEAFKSDVEVVPDKGKKTKSATQ